MGREASRTRIEARTVDLGGRLTEVLAPAHWSNARLDAWIDWATSLGQGRAADIPAVVADVVEELTARAQAKGLVKDVRARTRFRDELTEALLTGTIAVLPPLAIVPVSWVLSVGRQQTDCLIPSDAVMAIQIDRYLCSPEFRESPLDPPRSPGFDQPPNWSMTDGGPWATEPQADRSSRRPRARTRAVGRARIGSRSRLSTSG